VNLDCGDFAGIYRYSFLFRCLQSSIEILICSLNLLIVVDSEIKIVKANMKKISVSEFADFLTKKPLYYKIIAVTDFVNAESTFTIPSDFIDIPFKYKCLAENEIQTFKTKVLDESGRQFRFQISQDELPYYFDQVTGFLNLTFHLTGICQACGSHVDFLIKVNSTKSWEEKDLGIDIIVQKIGQFPPFEIRPDKKVEKYLTEEDLSFYKKALANFSISYGVGAYAYLRRVLENEIERIIEDVSKMNFDGVDYVQDALLTFKSDHIMSNLISVLNRYLPGSLKQFGDNPIKLLYEQLSDGIHSLSDEECLEKAESINFVLTYVIQKIYEEKTESSILLEAMKKLRKG